MSARLKPLRLDHDPTLVEHHYQHTKRDSTRPTIALSYTIRTNCMLIILGVCGAEEGSMGALYVDWSDVRISMPRLLSPPPSRPFCASQPPITRLIALFLFSEETSSPTLMTKQHSLKSQGWTERERLGRVRSPGLITHCEARTGLTMVLS
jgi:hypothetical protein